jgi:Methyltransferase domain
MKKDLQSYHKHDKDFNSESNSFEQTKKIIKEYDDTNVFTRLGFQFAVDVTKNLPKTHIDIGSGNGWLLRKMSPYFTSVIGIEPSRQGIEVAKQTTKECTNVSFINDDMVNALEKLEVHEPVFVTTATVLNHIENNYVAEFLKKVNLLPVESVLFFDERYDENIDWTMWHVRSKDWWRHFLPDWQIIFLDINAAGYPSGIYGVKVGTDRKLPNSKQTSLGKIFWGVNKLQNLINRILLKLKK